MRTVDTDPILSYMDVRGNYIGCSSQSSTFASFILHLELLISIDVLDLDFETSYGGHEFWGRSRVRETFNNMLKLRERISILWDMGLDAKQVVRKVFAEVPKKVLLMEETSEGEWSRINLVESILERGKR